MNLSFSTRGWDSLSWNEITDAASENGFQGVELYQVLNKTEFFEKGGPLSQYKLSATVRELRDSRISVVCLDTSLDLTDDEIFDKLSRYIELAGMMKIRYVSAVAFTDDEEKIVDALNGLTDAARRNDVVLLIKTTGIFADTGKLRDLLDRMADDNLAVLWDMRHPYYDCKESADTTIKNLGAYVKHVHLRDSAENGDYAIIGEGTLPINEMMQALRSIDYSGFISLEWKPGWVEGLNDHTLVFPHFINFMENLDPSKKVRTDLYPNHDGTGYYIWKKDELIHLTFSQVLDRLVKEFPNQYAFKYTTLEYTRTYSEFRDDVDDFARALVSLGVRAGSKVSVWATNIPEWFIAF